MIYARKAKYWAKTLGRLPGVLALFLSGSLAQGKGNKSSDIDFVIIAREGQIWTARFFIFVLLKLTGQLAKPHRHAGKICPNHFLTHEHLEIQEKNDYSEKLFTANKPLYDPHNLFQAFQNANAHWIKNFKAFTESRPNIPPVRGGPRGDGNFEALLKKIQISRIKANPEYLTPGAKIILSDTELRFHPKPKSTL